MIKIKKIKLNKTQKTKKLIKKVPRKLFKKKIKIVIKTMMKIELKYFQKDINANHVSSIEKELVIKVIFVLLIMIFNNKNYLIYVSFSCLECV